MCRNAIPEQFRKDYIRIYPFGWFGVLAEALYLLGLPVMVAGIWSGFTLYGKLDEAAFRKLMLLLLLASGVGLIAGQAGPLWLRQW